VTRNPALDRIGDELRRHETGGAIADDDITNIHSGVNTDGRPRDESRTMNELRDYFAGGMGASSDEDSITVTPYKHIMRRAIGSSDCPMVEATTPGQGAANALILAAALEEFGYLDAGHFGAVYDLGHVNPDMFAQPVVSIEGNGSQEFRMPPAIFDNEPEGGIYGANGTMFMFQGTVTAGGTASAVVNYGGEARLLGVRIIGPDDGSGTGRPQRLLNAVCGRMLDRFVVEGCDISLLMRGACIATTAVRYGGRICGNRLHDCKYDDALSDDVWGVRTPEMFGILIDDNKPANDSLVDPDRYIAWSDGYEIASNIIWNLTAINVVSGIGNYQTDGINFQTISRNHSCHHNRIWLVGDGIDGGPLKTIISDNEVSQTEHGIKSVFGMQDSIIANNNIMDSKRFGIQISNSGVAGRQARDIFITGNRVYGVNYDAGVYTAAAFNLYYDAAINPVVNLHVSNNVFDPGDGGTAAPMVLQGAADNLNVYNNFEVVRPAPGLATVLHSFTLGRVTNSIYKGPAQAYTTYVSAFLEDDLPTLSGNGTVVPIDEGWAEVEDRFNNFDPDTGLVVLDTAGTYEINFSITIQDLSTTHDGAVALVRARDDALALIWDWVFVAADIHNAVATGFVTISGMVSLELTAAQLPATVDLHFQVTGGAADCSVRGNASGFIYTTLSVKKV
jgi:hypothetical protein